LRKSSRNSASTAEEQGRLDSATDTVEIEMKTIACGTGRQHV